MKSFFKLLLLFCIITNTEFAQSYNFRIIKTNTENYPLVVSAVSVYDNSDDPCLDLTNDNFSILVDNKKVDSISSQFFQRTGKGMYFMLCIDLSATMKGQPLQAVKNSILNFIDNLRGIDKIGIMGFSDNAFLVSDFSSDKEYLKQKVRGLNTSGSNTSLYYGIYKGLEKLIDEKTDDGKLLIVLGDGKNENNAKSYTDDEVINKAKEEQIPIYSIGFSKINRIYLQTFEKMSDKTNGTFYNSPSDEQLDRNFSKLYNKVLNMYVLTYNVLNIEGDGKKHINTVIIKYNRETKTKFNEVLFPAGVAAITKISKNSGTNWLLYGGIGGGVLILGLGALFIVMNNKKKKNEIERQRLEFERRRADEEEMKRRKEIDEKQSKQGTDSKGNNNLSNGNFPFNVATQKTMAPASDRTVIISSNNRKIFTSVVLRIEIGPYQGNNFQINKNGAIIGRTDDNTIVLKDSNVSKHHAKISYTDGVFYIEDLNSTNGTYINANKVMNSLLNNGDTFKIGSTEGRIQVS